MHHVQICSRDYSGVRGAVWDYSDSQQDEEDFSTLAGAVKINRFMHGDGDGDGYNDDDG